jgi:hypothetical protein
MFDPLGSEFGHRLTDPRHSVTPLKANFMQAATSLHGQELKL